MRLEEQIILADTQVCLALLMFLQQDTSRCLRGGWALRKAWSAYQHTYNRLLALYSQTFGPDLSVPGEWFMQHLGSRYTLIKLYWPSE